MESAAQITENHGSSMIVCFVFLQHVTNYINTFVILFFDVMITRINNVTATTTAVWTRN